MSNTSIWTKTFWADAAQRSLATAGQAFALAVGADMLNVFQADWATLGGFALGGAVLSLAQSLSTAARVSASPAIDTTQPEPVEPPVEVLTEDEVEAARLA